MKVIESVYYIPKINRLVTYFGAAGRFTIVRMNTPEYRIMKCAHFYIGEL